MSVNYIPIVLLEAHKERPAATISECILKKNKEKKSHLSVRSGLSLWPHSKKILGSIPSWGRAFLCGVCTFSLCSRGSSPRTLVSPTIKTCTFGVSSVSTQYWLRIWSWSLGAALSTVPRSSGTGSQWWRALLRQFGCSINSKMFN